MFSRSLCKKTHNITKTLIQDDELKAIQSLFFPSNQIITKSKVESIWQSFLVYENGH